jgi:KDO2-lipid IV(A) lauroyltransferase
MSSLIQHAEHIHVLFRPDPFANFEAVRAASRQQLGVVEHDVDDGLMTWVKLREALRREQIVLIQADRTEPGQTGQAVPFFDGHIRVPTGPVRLALLTGAPIVPVFSFRDHEGLVQIHIGRPILVSDQSDPAHARAGLASANVLNPEQALLEFTRQLEIHVRQHPEQWLMLQPVWLEDQPAADVDSPRPATQAEASAADHRGLDAVHPHQDQALT